MTNNLTPGATGASRSKSITSLVLGIVSLASVIIPFFGLAGIAAVILGVLGRRSEPTGRTFALVGIITGVIGFILGVVGVIIGVLVLANSGVTVPTN